MLSERKSIRINRVQAHMDAKYIKDRLLHCVPALSELNSLKKKKNYHEKLRKLVKCTSNKKISEIINYWKLFREENIIWTFHFQQKA